MSSTDDTTRPSTDVGGTIVRRATARDAATLGALRAAMRAELLDEHANADAIAEFERTCVAHFARDFANPQPTIRGWVACDGERIVGTAVLMILPTLPRMGSTGSVDGRVRDVYVAPSHRRRGIARALMTLVLAEARTLEVDRLSLGASALGRPLYESLGFVTKRDEMVYDPPSPSEARATLRNVDAL